MVDVRVYKSHRYGSDNEDLVHAVSKRGVPVLVHPVESDVSVVISGHYENPCMLWGKKVLAFDATEWFTKMPVPKGFQMFQPILEHYYDEFINLSNLDIEEKADAIVKYVRGLNETEQPRGADRK